MLPLGPAGPGGPASPGSPCNNINDNILEKTRDQRCSFHCAYKELTFDTLLNTEFSGSEVVCLFSCSTQLIGKFIMLLNVKLSTIIVILTLISMINTTSARFKLENSLLCSLLVFMSR